MDSTKLSLLTVQHANQLEMNSARCKVSYAVFILLWWMFSNSPWLLSTGTVLDGLYYVIKTYIVDGAMYISNQIYTS